MRGAVATSVERAVVDRVEARPASTPPGLKSLHLTNAFHPSSGGVRTVLRSLMVGADTLRRPIRLVVPGERHGVEDIGPFARIYYVKAPRAFAVDRRYRLIMPWRYLLPWVEGIRQILLAEQPDVVEVCDKHSLLYVAGLLRKGWVGGVQRPTLVAHSAERFDDNVATFMSRRPLAMGFASWFMRTIYTPMFDYHLANSEYTAAELRQALPPHRQDVVRVISPSLSRRLGRPVRLDRRFLSLPGQGSPRTRVVLYLGRLSREKNLDLLFEMFRHLITHRASGEDDYQLRIAGDGPERARLEQCSESLGPGRVVFLGNLQDAPAVDEALSNADVLVHPNPREPFGLAPLEAMAAGLPIVVPDGGGVLSYADRSTAWIAAPVPEVFAATVRAVFSNPALAASRAAAGQLRARGFHDDVVVPRYFALLDDLHRERLARTRTEHA